MDSESDKVITFLCQTGKLKTLDRKGWTLTDRNIDKPESVAGHMYRMAVMSMMFTSDVERQVDNNKLIRMSLIHDMAECIVGDITPFDGVSKQEKQKLEMNAMNELVSLLPEKSSDEFTKLFHEYESQESLEAKIVKEFDRFDVMLQAFEYERSEFEAKGRVIKFQEFFDNCIGKISSKFVNKLTDSVNRQREEFWAQINQNSNKKL